MSAIRVSCWRRSALRVLVRGSPRGHHFDNSPWFTPVHRNASQCIPEKLVSRRRTRTVSYSRAICGNAAQCGDGVISRLPRLGSRVRIPSPAPNFQEYHRVRLVPSDGLPFCILVSPPCRHRLRNPAECAREIRGSVTKVEFPANFARQYSGLAQHVQNGRQASREAAAPLQLFS